MKTINLASIHPNPWLRQFPNGIPEWNGWRFTFNADEENYDYLVVFDTIPTPITPRCRPENIIHLSTEPPTALHYRKVCLNQFAWTIRQGKKKEIEGAIYNQPGLNWHIGWSPGDADLDKALNFSQIKSLFEKPKTKLISVIASNVIVSDQHKARLSFAKKIKEYYGSKIDFFGRGFVTMDDKIVALQDYRFHVVLENSSFDHYFSEKLTDCILAGTYPIYYGCPNIDEYFPKNTYQKIDIHDFDAAVKIIDNTIEQELDKKFRQELLDARDRVLNKYNLFPMLIEIISNIEDGKYGTPNSSQQIKNSEILPLTPLTSNVFTRTRIYRVIRPMLSKLANKYKLFEIIRNIYRKMQGR